MNKIIKLDESSSILSAQSGCILQNLDDFLSSYDLMMPLDLGSKGSCQIGGNVSTNAGGIRLLRYGSLKGRVLGLEVVLANGEILSTIDRPLRKDNTGYDLKNLFIGAEGTLGFVSAVSILCAQKPKAINAVLIACSGNSFKAVLDVFRIARRELPEIISAFEFMDRDSLICLKDNLKIENPFSTNVANECDFYCLVETHGSTDEHDREKLSKFFEILTNEKLCKDAIMAENSTQVQSLWKLRESIAVALNKDGYTYKYDISLPLEPMYDIVTNLRNRLKSLGNSNFRRCVGYGHVGKLISFILKQ